MSFNCMAKKTMRCKNQGRTISSAELCVGVALLTASTVYGLNDEQAKRFTTGYAEVMSGYGTTDGFNGIVDELSDRGIEFRQVYMNLGNINHDFFRYIDSAIINASLGAMLLTLDDMFELNEEKAKLITESYIEILKKSSDKESAVAIRRQLYERNIAVRYW